MIELIFTGSLVGLFSGFFGIGGGTILVPILLALGYETKVAIGISVVQMLFSSLFGSYLNHKNGSLDVKMVLHIALGGFLGALLSASLTHYLSSKSLEVIFLIFASFALVRMFFKSKEVHEEKKPKKIVLFFIGLALGTLSMTIGVGGSILLIPILVGFLHVPLQKAISAGLFFVVFSSLSGFISHCLQASIDFGSALPIAVSSLFGVYLGVNLKEKVPHKVQEKLLVTFYLLIVLYISKRVFLG